MPTQSHGTITFVDIRNNFAGYVNADGFQWGTNDANLYNLNYYRGKRYRTYDTYVFFPSETISINPSFYNADGNCACDCACDCACVCACDCACDCACSTDT